MNTIKFNNEHALFLCDYGTIVQLQDAGNERTLYPGNDRYFTGAVPDLQTISHVATTL